MVAEVDSKITSNGTAASSNGNVRAAKLQLARIGSPAPQPVVIDYQVSHDLEAQTGRFSDIAVHTGNVAAHVTGTYHLTPQAVMLDLRLAAPGLPIDQLEQLLPVVGIKLPSGSSLKGGTLSANLAIAGPMTETTISGPVNVENTTLAGFDIGSKIQGINPFGATGQFTGIQTVKANLHASPQLIQINDIDCNMPAIGTARGSGTVSPSGALNFNLVATFSPTFGSNHKIGTAVTSATAAVGTAVGGLEGLLGKKHAAKPATGGANHGIPITITGTAQNPSIRANIGAMLK
jgi:AsmA protein